MSGSVTAETEWSLFTQRLNYVSNFWKKKLTSSNTKCVSWYSTYVDIISYHKFTTYFSISFHHQADSPLQTTIAVTYNLFFNLIEMLKGKRIKNV
jgi:hypothetical protein